MSPDDLDTIGGYCIPRDPMAEDGDLNCSSCQ